MHLEKAVRDLEKRSAWSHNRHQGNGKEKKKRTGSKQKEYYFEIRVMNMQ